MLQRWASAWHEHGESSKRKRTFAYKASDARLLRRDSLSELEAWVFQLIGMVGRSVP